MTRSSRPARKPGFSWSTIPTASAPSAPVPGQRSMPKAVGITYPPGCNIWRASGIGPTGWFHGIDVLSCSPFQAAGTEIPCLSFKLFSMAATEQGRRHDHETTVDHALMRGLVTGLCPLGGREAKLGVRKVGSDFGFPSGAPDRDVALRWLFGPDVSSGCVARE